MPIGYDISTAIYFLGIRAASRYTPKAKRWIEGRKELWLRVKQNAPKLKGCIWMHCASMGEFEQGRPVLEILKKKRPDLPVLLTFFSPSGHEVMKGDPIATHVEYLPADSRVNAERFVSLIEPAVAIFVKYEFWYHHLHALHQRKVPTFLISANFRPDQFFFKWYGGTYRRMLGFFDRIFVQDQRSAELLRSINITNTEVSGDTRADRVLAIADRTEEIERIRSFRAQDDRSILICGSTWPQDEEVLIGALKKVKQRPRLIIAPHELDPHKLDGLCERLGGNIARLSKDAIGTGIDTLLIDSIGTLARAYKYGDIAYVGGGFSDGIHNILEPAVWGIPVIFGPDHKKFNEAKGLIEAGGGFQVKNTSELAILLDRLIGDEAYRRTASEAAARYVRKMAGATQRITNTILRSI